MPPRYEGLVCDLDGTILRRAQESATAEDITAIRKLIGRGVPVVIATGRAPTNTYHIVRELGIREPVITCYGAYTYIPDTQEVEEMIPLADSEVQFLTRRGLEKGHTVHLITPHGTIAIGSGTQRIAHLAPFLPDTTLPNWACAETIMVTLSTPGRCRTEDIVQEAWAANLACAIQIRSRMVTYTALETDKGFALRRLAARRSWDLRKFVAIGDDRTDLPLFAEVGLSIAVGTRFPELTELVEQQLSPDRSDAIAACIDEYF